MRKLKSARGEMVDFDLLKIKQEMEDLPPPGEVKQRQEDIDRKLRRRKRQEKKGTEEISAVKEEIKAELVEDSAEEVVDEKAESPKRKFKK